MTKFPKVIKNDYGIRPAGKQDECFYCSQKIGQEHKQDCVVVTKEVLIEYSIQVPIRVPHHWTQEDIESHRNESSWCANNGWSEIRREISKRAAKFKSNCVCDITSAKFIEVTDDVPRIIENEDKND